jgi:hypothetical protein
MILSRIPPREKQTDAQSIISVPRLSCVRLPEFMAAAPFIVIVTCILTCSTQQKMQEQIPLYHVFEKIEMKKRSVS